MSDIIYVKDLQTQASIGINKWERQIKQTISFDFEILADIAHAAESDDIENTINYRSISKRLKEYISDSHFNLLETLAEKCAQIIMKEFGVKGVRLRMSKPGAVRFSKDSGVIIERGVWERG